MAGTGSLSPFIKDEPEEQHFSGNKMFMNNGQLGMSAPYSNQSGFPQGVNPNHLNMSGGTPMSIQNGGFGHYQNSSGYSRSNSGAVFNDDELLDSFDNHQETHHNNSNNSNNQGQHGDYNDLTGMGYDMNAELAGQNGMGSMTIDHHTHLSNGYSNTPDGNPMASPFARSFTAEQFRHNIMQQQQQQFGGTPISYGGSPHLGSDMYSPTIEDYSMSAKAQGRPRMTEMNRRTSQTRSPMTPMTPKTPSLNVGDLNINASQPSSYPSQPIRTNNPTSHRHQKSLSSQDWGETPGSMASPMSSVFASPLQHGIHPNPQISGILQTGQHASLPAKVSNGNHSTNAPALQSQEMKRRRRRESHNLVERRRRDNINERIQELSHLVPLHRLEDEKIKKHLQNNSPLSPTLGSVGMSPPQATSGLAGPGARRATAGNITTGIPIEEKDKGPNKGDILNGAVSWTRDLMWMLHLKLQQHEELVNLIERLGATYPFTPTEDEQRMQSELMDAVAKNEVSNFAYSRTPGSGLRVPRHTNIKGEPLEMSNGGILNDNSLSPEDHSTGGDTGQNGLGMGGAGQYWSGHNSGGSGPDSIGGFKEEDEYQMDLTQ